MEKNASKMGSGDRFVQAYSEIISSILTFLEKKEHQQASIKEIIDYLGGATTKELVWLVIEYLSIRGSIQVIREGSRGKKITIKFLSRNLTKGLSLEEEFGTYVDYFCISFPPFNVFGLIEELKQKHVVCKTLLDTYMDLLKNAKKEIKICSPFIESEAIILFEKEFKEILEKNVIIKILTRELMVNKGRKRKIIDVISRWNVPRDQLFIRDYFFTTNDMRIASGIHAKLMIIDDEQAYIGSGEFRQNSFNKNFEMGIVITGTGAKYAGIVFDFIFSRSREVIIP
ncbi:MAG: phosphatidylserine/phosphatidylglycerophosphate/cardiolipin synthase family protein [Candidatus Sigynarchaeota archaeon]